MSSSLAIRGDLVRLLQQLIDIESVSGNEQRLADEVEAALRDCSHLHVVRDGNVVLARTALGRPERVLIAGHLDTVPIAGNVPATLVERDGDTVIYGRGACDMKGGVAVQLAAAAELDAPSRDVTWIFYDNEEVEADRNGLGRIAREHPEWLDGSFAVLCEPSNAAIEGGCQGTLRAEVTLTGTAAHSARAWVGHNAIHDAAEPLRRLAAYSPRRVVVDGLEYREGLNAVGIRGGIAGNIIPDRCQIEVNYRFAPDRTAAEAGAHVAEVFAGYDVRVTDAAPGARPGLSEPAAADFVRAIGGQPSAKFGWTDVARFAAMGIPAVNFGPGNPSKAHADDEFCPAADLTRCRAALVTWLS